MPYGDDPTEPPKVSRDQIAAFWKSKGAPDHVAAGIADRVVGVESGGKPTVVNKDSGATGLYQDLGERKSKLQALPHWQSPDVQNQFAYSEVTGGDKQATEGWEKIKAAKTREEASTLWDKYFERSGTTGGYGKDPVIGSGKWKVADSAIAYEQGRKNSNVVWMSPDDYLGFVPPLEADADNRTKRRSLMKSLGLGDDIEAIPTLDVKAEKGRAKVYDQDGRNRAMVAKEEGVDLIPVAIHGGVGDLKEIEGMTGTVKPLDFKPVAVVPREPTQAPTTRTGQFLSGARTILEGAGQLVEHSLPDVPGMRAREEFMQRQDQESAARLKDLEKAGTTRTWPYIAGEVAATLPTAAIAPAAGAGIGGTIAAGAAAGALGGLAEPVEDPSRFWAEKAQQAAVGGAAGAVTGGLGGVVGNALAPVVRPAVNKLVGEGVRLTPGQVMGGAFKRAEDVAGSVPILGAAVRGGQNRAIEDFNRAAWNRSLAPIGEKLPADMPVGREAADYTAQTISDAYNRVVPKLKAIPDQKFAKEATAIAQKARNQLPDKEFGEFWRLVKAQLFEKLPATGKDLQGIDSMLGFEATAYRTDPSRDKRVIGQLLGDLQESFRDLLERGNPAYAKAYKDVRQAFATNVRVERAAGAVGARNGVFTPAQLSNAVKATDPSARKGAYARGNAMLQDLSDAAKDVLPQRVPDSGTPERMALMGVLGGAAHVEPLSLIGGAALSLPYTGAGMNSLRWWMTHLPRTRNALATVARTAGVGAGPGAGMMLSPPGP